MEKLNIRTTVAASSKRTGSEEYFFCLIMTINTEVLRMISSTQAIESKMQIVTSELFFSQMLSLTSSS